MSASFFNNQRVLLTGATGGLGATMARQLAQAGARLALSARHRDALENLAASLPSQEPALVLPADLSRPNSPGHLASAALERLGGVDVLFNIAGQGYFTLMEEARPEAVRNLFEVNTFAPLALIHALLPAMKKQGRGRIVNIVSCAGRVPIPTVGVYGGSKSALAVMCNTMRLELAPLGVEVINIYPGTVDTAFEANAMRERDRHGLCPVDRCGAPRHTVARRVIAAAAGPPGEVWLERAGKWLSVAALVWPAHVDRRLAGLRDKSLSPDALPARRWRLLQVESALACNLRCVMCPWTDIRRDSPTRGVMTAEVWEAIRPHLPEIRSVDFTGGGEPLMQPLLVDWVDQAHRAGCETGFLTNGMLLTRDKAAALLDAGIDWIGISMDGATPATYEHIRLGADFQRVCDHVSQLTAMRVDGRPKVMINFVLMRDNFGEADQMVTLAARLGVDQINFKQCDVIRGQWGRGHGLFTATDGAATRRLERALARVRRKADKLGLATTTFAFTPEELPVCQQDPTSSIFVRFDGRASPCINLAIGGPTTFLGREVTMPAVHYGQLPGDDLAALWETPACRTYRDVFEKRVSTFDRRMAEFFVGGSGGRERALENARRALPQPPDGCRICHYLYDI